MDGRDRHRPSFVQGPPGEWSQLLDAPLGGLQLGGCARALGQDDQPTGAEPRDLPAVLADHRQGCIEPFDGVADTRSSFHGRRLGSGPAARPQGLFRKFSNPFEKV